MKANATMGENSKCPFNTKEIKKEAASVHYGLNSPI